MADHGTVQYTIARSNKGIRQVVERFDVPDQIYIQLAAMAMPLTMLRNAV